MHVDAHSPEEVEGLDGEALLLVGEKTLQHGLAERAFGRQRPRDPEQGVEIAQAALAVLDVGLDLIADGAGPGVAGVALGELGGDEGAGVGLLHLFPEPVEEGVGEGGVACEMTRLQKGRADGHVLTGQTQGFVRRPYSPSDLEAEIPQGVQQGLNNLLGPGRRLAGSQHHQVEIGIGRQHAAPVAADGEKTEPFGGRGLVRLSQAPQGGNGLVGGDGVEARGLHALEALIQLLPRPLARRLELGAHGDEGFRRDHGRAAPLSR